MNNLDKGRALSERQKNLLREIPVYPQWKICRTAGFPVDAPLAEEYGKVCYISDKAKQWYVAEYVDGNKGRK